MAALLFPVIALICYRFVSVVAATIGLYFVQLKWLICPVAAAVRSIAAEASK